MKNKCSVLVCSCDKYNDTWDLFFRCWEANWKNCPYEIYLNTEELDYNYFGNLKVNVLKTGKVAWGKRLKRALKMIDSQYVIFMLDDFFLLESVDVKKFNQCMQWMDDNRNISVFSFFRTRTENLPSNYLGFEKRPKKCEYKLNCQAALWRRKKLIGYIRNHESPWDWELLGSIRANRYNEEFYSIHSEERSPFIYNLGGGIHGGKWLKEIQMLAQKYNINIDFSRKGFFGETDIIVPKNTNKKFFNRVLNRLKYEYKRFKSLI